ncbi:DUF1491 family protein [Segnochrobactraceae bacterium EtOH-i3]
MRLTSAFYVSALIRTLDGRGIPAVVARRGATEAGAVFVRVNRLDRTADLYAPAPQMSFEAGESDDRLFERVLEAQPEPDVSARLASEIRFDSDLWIVEIDDRNGAVPVPLAKI